MLLFIKESKATRQEVERIQIHLMLLFIVSLVSDRMRPWYSNTSYVVIYRVAGIWYNLPIKIQIHLMLLFIEAREDKMHSSFLHSNTSYVVIYPLQKSLLSAYTYIQIHLMLLFIFSKSRSIWDLIKFKYILCCYLSRLEAIHKSRI